MTMNLAVAQLAPPIMNPGGRHLDWGDYRIEVNQYGDLGRNWPTPDEFWKGYERLKQRARANPDPPNTLRTLLLVIPRVHATAVREVDGRKEVIGHRLSEMTSAEIQWNLEQWREFEEMVFVFSGGNAWLRTDIKVIDEPLEVETDENWEFWAGQQRELLDKYLPFERGDYQSYNCIYGSGEPPSGVRVFPDLPPNRQPVALDEPVRHEFKQPTFFEWADVKDDPWLRLPRLDQADLRDLTGIPSLAIKTDGSPWTAPDGTEYNPPRQHLFLEIPSVAVGSPWLAAPEENSGRLNNDLDFNWKSMAWLRLKERPEGRDLLLVRFDVAEPLLHLLRTRGRKASESLVGWVLVEHKLAYVVLVDLELDRTPDSALDLLNRPGHGSNVGW
jgi:hypothetical protein